MSEVACLSEDSRRQNGLCVIGCRAGRDEYKGDHLRGRSGLVFLVSRGGPGGGRSGHMTFLSYVASWGPRPRKVSGAFTCGSWTQAKPPGKQGSQEGQTLVFRRNAPRSVPHGVAQTFDCFRRAEDQ